MKSIALSQMTALGFLMNCDTPLEPCTEPPKFCGLHADEVKDLQSHPLMGDLKAPLQFLVSDRNERRTTHQAEFSCIQTELPQGSFLHYPDSASDYDLYICSPEFCFVQMAKALDMLDLVALGYEICGSYERNEPLTTAERLLEYALRAEGLNGAKAARKAAQHVLNGSQSPDETLMAMLVSLPRSLGGIGAVAPLLNQAIEAPDSAARILGTRHFKPTLYWPAIKTAVEYDPRTWHNPEAHAEYNRRKANAYKQAGLEVITIGPDEIRDLEFLRVTFEEVDRRQGKRKLPVNEKQRSKQRETHRRLVR